MVVRLFDPWMGGMEKQSLALAHALKKTGHGVHVVTGRWFRGSPRRQEYDGIEVIRHGALFDGFGIRGVRRVGAIVYMITLALALFRLRRTYDLIHVHGLSYHAYVAVRLGRLLGKPVIVKLANSGQASDITKMENGQHIFFSRQLLATALTADRFVALNDTIRHELVAAGVPPRRIIEIPNGVHVPDLPARQENMDPERVISYVGRLHEQKAVDVLIRAIAALEGPVRDNARILIVGDGPARPDLESLVGALAEDVDLEFLGEVDDIDLPLSQTDLVVLPSLAEGMSNTLLEAMARGIPVVASDIPANAVLVDHGENGWLFPPSDWRQLSDLIASILPDRLLLQKVGDRARHMVTERYAIDHVAREYSNLYGELSR